MSVEDPASPAGAAEIGALTSIVRALQPLTPETRQRVVESALVLLGSKGGTTRIAEGAAPSEPSKPLTRVTDIRGLKEEKRPASANEMAALVAYYLAEVAAGTERKPGIEISDIEKYFKQAGFRLPRTLKMTLVNAKNAGYFDAVGEGRYKLNPVGYNLVAHSLPRTGSVGRVAGSRGKARPQASSRRPGRKTARRAKGRT
jgi:hypothetical protein